MRPLQIRRSHGFRGELHPYRLMPEAEHSSVVFTRSDDMPPLAVRILSVESAPVALGRFPENRTEVA